MTNEGKDRFNMDALDNSQNDKGIQDVLAEADRNRESGTEYANGISGQNSPVKLDRQEVNENGDSTNKLENELKENSETEEIGRGATGLTRNKPSNNHNIQLDLADPESVIHMLETVDLTEEDTEGLLQEAYNMNRKLKEMLRRQENGASPSIGSKSKSNGKAKSKPRQSQDTSSNSSESGSRVGSAFGARKILPPISQEKETSVYAIKLKRSRTNMADTKAVTSEPAVPRSKSSKAIVRKVTTKYTIFSF